MNPFSSDQVESINQLILNCGEKATQMAEQPFQVFEKGAKDYVTNVDRLLDEMITTKLSELFPNDGIISEENVQSRQAFHNDYQRLWLIDPLDGTDDFIQHSPHYAVMVGLLQQGEPIAGWVHAPASGQLYYGGTGWGLFHATSQSLEGRSLTQPKPLIPTEPPPLSEEFCPIIIGDKDRRIYGKAIAHLIPGVEFSAVGSFGLKVMQIVLGKAGLYLYLNRKVKLWDTVGPIALAHAAGLVCCDLDGHPLKFTAHAIDPDTLAHQQPIIIGWASYVEALRPRLQQAIQQA
ncbi:inositol monophosphatase family protein [Oscillatoria sp. FACHB-1407]|uniref:3'(2'),5'-bisphosphate nucleotidase CysQ family protein n=1 Tax=Oscillatoria sp. FACHB-1407 TaxID=2692847 RepID=UPI0016850415|nr:inositol monophosphatase family protein [Oscillatoria sp. FACHB-1407]MBD2464330.1 inositol monophosphatase family protein [Oscillatoria sp. FACHB-1407]